MLLLIEADFQFLSELLGDLCGDLGDHFGSHIAGDGRIEAGSLRGNSESSNQFFSNDGRSG